jgi:hypothetical protein
METKRKTEGSGEAAEEEAAEKVKQFMEFRGGTSQKGGKERSGIGNGKFKRSNKNIRGGKRSRGRDQGSGGA